MMRYFGVSLILAVVIASAAARSGCLCGGLGDGTNPCAGSGGHGGPVGVRGYRGPRPQYFASSQAIADAAAARAAYAAAAALKSSYTSSVSRSGSGCGGLAAFNGEQTGSSSSNGYYATQAEAEGYGSSSDVSSSVNSGGLTAAELLSLGSDAFIAPRFSPVGNDPCFGKSSAYTRSDSSSARSRAVVVPAKPGKPRCLTCGNYAYSGYGSGGSGAAGYGAAGYGAAGYGAAGYGAAGYTSKGYGSKGYGAYSSGRYGSYGSGAYTSSGSSSSCEAARNEGCSCNSGASASANARAEKIILGPCGGAGPAWGGAGGYGAGAFGGNPLGRLLNQAYGGTNPLATGLGGSPYGAGGLNEFDDLPAPALSFEEQEKIYNRQNTQVPQVPADPVSVALAYKKLLEPLQNLANSAGGSSVKGKIASESSLAFGPKTLPADGREKKVESDVPEERLSTVDKPVVELKPQALAALQRAGSGSAGAGGCDEEDLAQQEALERERQLQEEEDCCNKNANGLGAYISYSDLGYGPVAPSGNTFVTRGGSASLVSGGGAAGGVGGVVGYAAGGAGGVVGFAAGGAGGVARYTAGGAGGYGSSGASGYGSSSVSNGADEDDGGPCGPLGEPLPDYVPGGIVYERLVNTEEDEEAAAARAAAAAAAAAAEAAAEEDYDDSSDENDEDQGVATSCGGSAHSSSSSGASSRKGQVGRLSKLWTQAQQKQTVNSRCTAFTS